jgi:hypothetical protein
MLPLGIGDFVVAGDVRAAETSDMLVLVLFVLEEAEATRAIEVWHFM